MNRIHGWLAGHSPFEYHVATASVLPLQGLWNAVIFFVTSGRTLRECFRDWRVSRATEGKRPGIGMEERGQVRGDSSLDDGDSGTMGSDVELRRVMKMPGKRVGVCDDEFARAF